MRNALLEPGADSQYEQFLIPVANGETQTGFDANMIIGMRSRSVINKKAHNKAARNIIFEFAFDKTLGNSKLGKVCKVVSIAKTGMKIQESDWSMDYFGIRQCRRYLHASKLINARDIVRRREDVTIENDRMIANVSVSIYCELWMV